MYVGGREAPPHNIFEYRIGAGEIAQGRGEIAPLWEKKPASNV